MPNFPTNPNINGEDHTQSYYQLHPQTIFLTFSVKKWILNLIQPHKTGLKFISEHSIKTMVKVYPNDIYYLLDILFHPLYVYISAWKVGWKFYIEYKQVQFKIYKCVKISSYKPIL